MAASELKLEDAVNETCPWSGKPIAADSLTRYQGAVVGFCNPGCRDKFALRRCAPGQGADGGTLIACLTIFRKSSAAFSTA
jgi:hypothetical protein